MVSDASFDALSDLPRSTRFRWTSTAHPYDPPSPVRPLRVSMYAGGSSRPDQRPRPLTVTWEALAADLTQHRSAGTRLKVQLPAWSWAEFPEACRARLTSAVLRVHGWCYDLDDVPTSVVRDLTSRLRSLGWASVLYTTWQHGRQPGVWRLRVAGPYAEPIPRQRHRDAWRAVAYALGISEFVDGQCSDVVRLMFGPIVPPDLLPLAASIDLTTPASIWCDVNTLTKAPANAGDGVLTATVRAPVTKDRLKRLAASWRQSSKKEGLAEALKQVVEGNPYADPGERDTTTWALACALAPLFPTDEDAKKICDLFAPSLQVMGSPTAQELHAKLLRARRVLEDETQVEEDGRVSRIKAAFAHTDPERDYGYLDHELDEFAERVGCARAELRNRWILQTGKEFRFLVNGEYTTPYQGEAAQAAALRDLAPAEAAGLKLRDEEGRPLSIASLTNRWGTAVATYSYDLTTAESKYHADVREFRQASAPIRKDLVPQYDPQIARWLSLLFGDELHEICAWLATVPDLTRTLCSAVLIAPAGCGKSLFAGGLARLWSTIKGPVAIEQVFGSWNDPLIYMPLVFADEVGIPANHRGQTEVAKYRRFVSDHVRPMTRRHRDDTTITGAIRTIFALNNESILSLSGDLTHDDIQAIAERMYLFRYCAGDGTSATNERAERVSHFFQTLDTHPKSFIHEDRLAKFVLWLRDNYQVPPEWQRRRFLLPSSNLANRIANRSRWVQDIYRWLVAIFQIPEDRRKEIVRILPGDHAIGVTPVDMATTWKQYLDGDEKPHFAALARTLRMISEERKLPMGRRQKVRPVCAIPRGNFLQWCELNGVEYRELPNGQIDTTQQKEP